MSILWVYPQCWARKTNYQCNIQIRDQWDHHDSTMFTEAKFKVRRKKKTTLHSFYMSRYLLTCIKKISSISLLACTHAEKYRF